MPDKQQSKQNKTQNSPKRIHRIKSSEMDIKVGSRVQVEPLGMGEKFQTDFLGMKRGKFIIVGLPGKFELREHLNVDSPVALRYLHNGYHICGFRTTIAARVSSPAPMLFLHYPSEVEVLNLRNDDRVECFFPGAIFFGGSEIPGRIVNLSQSGTRFAAQATPEDIAKLDNDTEIFCMIKVAGADDELYIKAKVKNISMSQTTLGLGLAFLDLEDDHAATIEYFIQNVKQFTAA